LAERNTRDKENGDISPSVLHVKRKDLTSLFRKKDTINEIISGGKRRNHGLCVAIPDEGPCEAIENWYVSELEGAQMRVNNALNRTQSGLELVSVRKGQFY
jgi:hypothetical protein